MKRFISIFVGIVLVFALIIPTGCKKQPEEIKIGVLTTLTGESARYGQSALNGIQIAVKEINAKGGIKGKPIKLIIEDDASHTSLAVSAFRKLAAIDRVSVIIGPISSSASMSCSPVANKLKVILFSPSAATPVFTSPDDYTFRNRVSSEFEIFELARTAHQTLELRKIAILYVNNDYGLGNKNSFEKAFQELGGTIIAIETFDEGATDMRTQLSKIKQLRPDGIFIVGQGSEGGYILKQARELGIRSQFLSTITIQRSDVLQTAEEAANGVIFTLPAYDPKVFKEAEEFERKYKEMYKQDSDLFSGNGYDALYIIVKAIAIVGYSADKIKNALFNIRKYPGVTGETSFDRNGDVIKPVAIKKIEGGKFVYFNEGK